MRVVISNFGPTVDRTMDFAAAWDRHTPDPLPEQRETMFEQPVEWGFHLYAMGVRLLDLGKADEVEFWDYGPHRGGRYLDNGILSVKFWNERDIVEYLKRTRPIDLFVNHGFRGGPVLSLLDRATFRVHVPTLRTAAGPLPPADCYLFDAEDQLTDRSMVYVPVVHTEKIRPGERDPEFDFVYLASVYEGKRHDLLIDAVRGSGLTGHLHPVAPGQLDVRGTGMTTSAHDERGVVELLQSARIAVYPGDRTSAPAAMWECVAADLPIVVNAAIGGGKHVVVPGITGEFAHERNFLETMKAVLAARTDYRPRQYLLEHWDTIATTEQFFEFFAEMGWKGWP